MTCSVCRRAQEDGFRKFRCRGIETVEACHTGEVPKLIRENEPFWFLFQRMLPGLFDGYGGVNFTAIFQVLDLYKVPAGQRPIIHDKCLVVIAAVREIQEQERIKHGK
ncbi:MAG: hypothetical protein JRF50_12915 [Deltaproteobacteria bacterium]|nr:hypothetical protein [Deltaproteobacteria bacterium]